MKIVGILLLFVGMLVFLGGAAVGVTLAFAGPPARCNAVEFAKQRAEAASRDLAAAAGTSRQAELQQKANDANSALRQAMGFCDEAWTGRYIQLGAAACAGVIGAVMALLGLVLFFVGRRRAKRALA